MVICAGLSHLYSRGLDPHLIVLPPPAMHGALPMCPGSSDTCQMNEYAMQSTLTNNVALSEVPE